MRAKLNLNQIEKILPIMIIILSLNKITAILACIILLIYGIRNSEKAVKAIIYNFILSQLNPTIFSSPGSIRTIINIILILSIFRYKGAYEILRKRLVSITLLILGVYIVIVAVIVSWLPLVSIFKGIYFTSGFLGIYIGVNLHREVKWIAWIENYFKFIVGLNFICIFLSKGYSTNGRSLNGIFANPNALGIVTVLAVAVFIYTEFNKKKFGRKIFIFIAIIEIFISNSRTSILTLGCIFIYTIFFKILDSINSRDKKEFEKKILILTITLVMCSIMYKLYGNEINNFLEKKILKGQKSTQVLASRDGQIEAFEKDFEENKLFGVGFGVDGSNNRMKIWDFKLSYPVERGNIALALLAETGLIGTLLFIIFILALIIESIKSNGLKHSLIKVNLIISVLMISVGEMSFFSGNGVGVLQWFILIIYSSGIIE